MQVIGLAESVLKPVLHMHWYEPALLRDLWLKQKHLLICFSLRSSRNCIMTFLVRTTVRCSIKTFVYVDTYLDFKAGIVGEYVSSLASTVIRSFVGFKISLRTDHLFPNAFDKP